MRSRPPRRAPKKDGAAAGRGLVPPASSGVRPEILRRIRSLELRTRGLVDSLFSGDHSSIFHGRGFEFSFARPYQPGDDIRAIDWRITARRRIPYVRQFVEERDLLVVVVVDVSASSRLGPGRRSAGEVAADVSAALAFAAARQNDRFALVLTSDELERVVPPGSGRKHAIRVLDTLLEHEPRSPGTDLAAGLEWVDRSLPRRATVFVLSDFIQGAEDPGFREMVSRVARRHDLIGIRVASRAADELPDVGWVEMTDPETNRRVVLDTGLQWVRDRFRRDVLRGQAETADVLARAGAELLDVNTATDPLLPLAAFLHARARVR